MPSVQDVIIRDNEFLTDSKKTRFVTQIEIFIGGMWLSKDLNNERDEKLALRLAKESGVKLRDYRKK